MILSQNTRYARMQGYLRERGDINIKRPHSNRRKIVDKVFIVRLGGRLMHFQIMHSPPYIEIQQRAELETITKI